MTKAYILELSMMLHGEKLHFGFLRSRKDMFLPYKIASEILVETLGFIGRVKIEAFMLLSFLKLF